MSIYYICAFFIPFLVGVIFVPLVRRIALSVGFVDVPSARKIHSGPIPLGGGLIVFIGFLLVFILLTSLLSFADIKSAIGIIAGAILIFLIGVYDDAYEMGVVPKMLGQIIAAIIFLTFVEKIPSIMSLPVYFLFGTFWIVGIQNALNFLDNMDGLCAGVSMSIAIGLGVLFIFKDMPIFAIMSFALAGGALGFLRYNLPPASIFLGDTGSLLFGFGLSSLAIVHLNTSKSLAGALAPLIIMAYPVFDLTFVTISRLSEGRKVYIGGKDHSSHKINFMGLTRRATVFTIYLINALLVIFGVAVFFMGDSPYQIILMVILASILAFTGTHIYKNILYLKHKISKLLLDLAAINLTFAAYVLVKYQKELIQNMPVFKLAEIIIPLAWINIFWILLYSAFGLYDLPYEIAFKKHIYALARVVVIGIVVFAFAAYKPGEGFRVLLSSLGIFAATQFTINISLRYAYHKYLGKKLISQSGRLDALIIKLHPGPICDPDILKFNKYYQIKGYVGDLDEVKIRYLGPECKLSDVLHENRIARVILDLPEGNYQDLLPIFNSVYYMDTKLLVKNSYQKNLRGLKRYETRFGSFQMIATTQTRIFARILKRLCDFGLATGLLVISSPWITAKLLYARIKKDKFIYSTSIIGRSEKPGIIKCPRGTDGQYRFRNPWGLLAVLRGDLSLVGTTVTFKSNNGQGSSIDIPGEWRKFLTKPGLFGPGYEGRSKQERFDLDLDYIEKSSIISDIVIGLKQFFKISMIGEKDSA
jgi:UDP-GlcNAc:undecaprenyl-phosphate/decaprenyl-phosphate GlcNAc-1-phosphate transferase